MRGNARTALAGLTGAAVLAAAMGACTPDPQPSPTTRAPSMTSASPDAPTSPVPDSDLGPGAADRDEPTPIEVPTWDEAAQVDAAERATDAVTAFARPHLDQPTWLAELTPYLSAAAARDHASVDPANVPASSVTGTAEVQPSQSPWLATVSVPTDAGPLQVLLSRQGPGDAWLVERISQETP